MEKKLVLVVEDNLDARLVCAAILQYAGFGVVEAENGAEGVRLARASRPDLVLTDLSMPVLSGWGVLEQLKGDEETRGIPVAVVSAHGSPEDMKRARSAGAADYLVKPCPPRLLLERVHRLIGPAVELDPPGDPSG